MDYDPRRRSPLVDLYDFLELMYSLDPTAYECVMETLESNIPRLNEIVYTAPISAEKIIKYARISICGTVKETE
tara:strand:+ start:339 stop:560 length:222 start_codon:yes stop_codon:yes gene_type:complete